MREQLDYSRRLFGLQCEELFDLRARVAELEGLRAPGEHAQSSEPSEPSEASKKRAEEVRVLKRDKLMAVIANKSLRAEAERSRDEARDAKHSREMMEALLTENRAERIILGVDKDTATQTPGPPLDESASTLTSPFSCAISASRAASCASSSSTLAHNAFVIFTVTDIVAFTIAAILRSKDPL